MLKLKTPYRNGTSHLVMSPLESMQRLAVIVPFPAPARSGHATACEHAPGASARMSWARLLKREFDIERCAQCGSDLLIIAAIEAPAVIERIVTHLGSPAQPPPRTPPRRVDLCQAA